MKTRNDSLRKSAEWGHYVLDNSAPQAPARFAALAALYDETTIRHLERIGVDGHWCCWEIGAGSGSIAYWLSEKVAGLGSVLATDIDTRYLSPEGHVSLKVQRHDIASDALPNEAFDLIHARLVLVHLPQREQVLEKMIAALKPGGWLLSEEFDSLSQLPAPSTYTREVSLRSVSALRQIMAERGVDAGFGRSLPGLLLDRGMQNVSAEGRLMMWSGGSAGAALMQANLWQLRDEILSSGSITVQEFEADIARLEQNDFIIPSPVMWSVSAQRPPGA